MLSCIDDKYRIDEIDKEVHFAPGGASFPLGYIEKKKLGDIIGDKLSIISEHESGYYVLRQTGEIGYKIGKININEITFGDFDGFFGEGIKVNPKDDGDQLPKTIAIDRKSLKIAHDIPSFDMSGESVIEKLDLTKSGEIPGGLSGTVTAGKTFSGSFISGAEATIEIDVTLPEQVKDVETVWLKDKDNNPSPEKTTVKFALNFGGVSPVMQSLKIDEFTLTLPGRYKIQPGAHGGSITGNSSSFTMTNFNMGGGPYILEFYITEADLSDLTPDAGNRILKEEKFSYTIKYTLTTKAGEVGSALPTVNITGAPEFRDAKFTTNKIDFKVDTYTYDFSQTIGGISDVVENVSYVAFAGGGNTLTLKMGDLGLPDSFQNELPIMIKFPESFDIEPVAGELENNVLTVMASDLVDGYDLTLNGIGFTGTAATPNSKGELTVAGAIEVSVNHKFDEATLLWSDDIARKNVPEAINVEIEPKTLTIDYTNSIYTASQKVEANGWFDESFELPSVIKGVSQVLIAKAAEGTDAAVEMTLSVEINNWLTDKLYLDDFNIQLPSFLMIDASSLNKPGEAFDADNNTYSNNRITIQKPADGSTKVGLVNFNVNGMKGITLDDGKAALKGDLKFSAIARTPDGATINPEDEMTITPKLEISDIVVTGLDGMLDLEDYIDNDKIDPIDFSELFKYLNENKIQQPNLAAPVLTLDIVNPLGIKALGNVALYPRNADGELICEEPITLGQDNRFKIEPSGATHVYISDNGVAKAPKAYGYVGYDLKLSDLVNVIPHTVDISLSGTVNPNKDLISSMLLGDNENEFSLAYTIEVPFLFGPDMSMELKFDVDDLNKTFSKLAEQKVKAADITVFAGFTVTFPLIIEDVKVEFTDSQGGTIEGLETTVSGSIAGPAKAGDKAQESILSVRMIVPKGGDFATLSDIDIMKITIPISSANRSGNAQNQLSPNDTIEGRVWIELAKGVSVNLGDLE